MYKQISTLLYKKYVNEVVPELKKLYNIDNYHDIPEIERVIVNIGIRQAKDDKGVLEEALNNMASITGQQPAVTRARKSISNFALREGSPIGCKVTLRGKMMYEFMEKVLRIAIPRIRDFSGLKRSFDKYGNLSIGIIDESIFPEVDADKLKTIKGLSITMVTNKYKKDESVKLFELLGFPFIEV